MSLRTSPKSLHKFIVYAPDKSDEGAYARRLSVREAHLKGAKELTEKSFMRMFFSFNIY
jgi:hypothetical protein